MKQVNKILCSLVGLFLLFSAHAADIVTVTYIHNDALGSPIAATDEQGDLVWREEYRPFGERIIKDTDAKGNTTWYTGHKEDNSGLVYMQRRYYDPVIGRFMGVDPAGVDPTNVHTFNRYAYAANNPYKYVDPDGEAFFIPFLIFAAKEAVSTAVESFVGVPLSTKSIAKAGFKKIAKTFKRCCFAAGTPILTKDGFVSIEKIKIGDLVAAKDETNGKIDWKPVTKLHVRDKPIYELIFKNKKITQTFKVTDDHPFWVKDKGWVEVKDLILGSQVQNIDEQWFNVVNLKNLNPITKVYNVTVADYHTYFVGNSKIWVHNCPGTSKKLAKETSRAKRRAAREAQRQHGTPTSIPGKNQQGRPGTPRHQIKEGSNGKPNGIVDGSNDTVPGHGPHIEAGDLKAHDPINKHGQPRLRNGKSKVDF